MKKAFLAGIILFGMFDSVYASNTDSSDVLLSNILNQLAETQSKMRGRVVEGSLFEKRMSMRQGVVIDTNKVELASFNARTAFFKWGYIAQETAINTNNMSLGAIIERWDICSNGIAEDTFSYANPTSRGIYLPGRSVEVSVSSGFGSFVPFALIPSDLSNFISNMDDIKVSQTADLSSEQMLILDGTWDSPGLPEEKVHIVFDPAHDMFPVQGDIYRHGSLLNRWEGVFSASANTGYFPESFVMDVFGNQGVNVFSKSYTGMTVTSNRRMLKQLMVSRVVAGAIVNDSRFSHAFAYTRGYRDPTPGELLAMSTNNAPISGYQRAMLAAPLGPPTPHHKARWIIVAFIIVSAILSWIIIYNWQRRRKAVNP